MHGTMSLQFPDLFFYSSYVERVKEGTNSKNVLVILLIKSHIGLILHLDPYSNQFHACVDVSELLGYGNTKIRPLIVYD